MTSMSGFSSNFDSLKQVFVFCHWDKFRGRMKLLLFDFLEQREKPVVKGKLDTCEDHRNPLFEKNLSDLCTKFIKCLSQKLSSRINFFNQRFEYYCKKKLIYAQIKFVTQRVFVITKSLS